jgi:adenylate cyclase
LFSLWSRLWAALIGRHGIFALSLAVAGLIWAALHFAAAPTLNQLDERSGDLVWRLSADHKDERRLIVVDIDERSLREVGPWPWSRATQAKLVQQIAATGAKQQIYDIVFASTSADSGAGDVALAQAIAQHKPVLAQVFALEQGGKTTAGQLAGALDWGGCPAPFDSATGYLANVASVFGGAASSLEVGHITPRIASDGLVRQQPAVICYRGKSYPALGLAALMRGTGVHELALERGAGFLDAPWKLSAPSLSAGAIPLDDRGDLRVSWRLHPDSFISLSAADVLAGRVPPGLLDSAWVLVGSSAFGLNDSIATPFGGAGAGLQVHAQVITALIDGRTPYTPRTVASLQCLAAAMGALLLLLLSRARTARRAGKRHFPEYLLPLAAAAWSLVLWVCHAALLAFAAMWLGWVEPALFVLLVGASMGILEHAKSRLDRDRLYAHLSSYLPAPVAASLALQPPSSAIKASTNMVSVLFADIRNFSAYCEARPPEEAAAVLHAFFSTATKVIEAQGGVIEAFQGDAILAVWNGEPDTAAATDPTHGSDHARRALQAAINLQSAMHGVLPDPAPAGLEPLALGIGVESGPAMAGSFGLASRRTHMVMGRTVTIASRLVDMTAELAHPILVGEGLAAQVGASGLESMGTFMLDGMRVPHHVYAHPLYLAPVTAPSPPHLSIVA